MAFRRSHLAPDIVVWIFVFDIKKLYKKTTQRIPSTFTFLGTIYYGYTIITVFMGIQPLSNFFQQDEISGCLFLCQIYFYNILKSCK